MESRWLTRLKQIHAIAQSGLAYCSDPFDEERYHQLSHIALQMMSDLTNTPIESLSLAITPVKRRYLTPFVEVRGALFDSQNQVLLAKETVDGRWSLPGGYADVGLSAKENIEKEMLEETGVKAKATRLVAVRHKAKSEYEQDSRDFYKLIFLCEMHTQGAFSKNPEISEVGFFPLDALPDLSLCRTIERDLHDACRAHRSPVIDTIFD